MVTLSGQESLPGGGAAPGPERKHMYGVKAQREESFRSWGAGRRDGIEPSFLSLVRSRVL